VAGADREGQDPKIEEERARRCATAADPGLHNVYDQHTYLIEKRRSLDLWEKRLLTIVAPPPDVTDLADERAKRAAS
jgi:hypothetical protein